MSRGCTSAEGLERGQGLAKWWCSLCSLQAALGVSPKLRALLLSFLRTKICPACDSFQRPWQLLLAVVTAIWKPKWCSGEGQCLRWCPLQMGLALCWHLWKEKPRGSWVCGTSRSFPLCARAPCVGASFCPQENCVETQQPALPWVRAKDYTSICLIAECSSNLSGLKEKCQSG